MARPGIGIFGGQPPASDAAPADASADTFATISKLARENPELIAQLLGERQAQAAILPAPTVQRFQPTVPANLIPSAFPRALSPAFGAVAPVAARQVARPGFMMLSEIPAF